MTLMTHIPVRDRRDRLIDLLKFGQTYPLRDLPVGEEALTVPFNTSAKIPVHYSQPGVLYQLHFDGKLVTRPGSDHEGAEPVEIAGTGSTVILETARIQEDITYDVYAIKDMPPNRAVYLHQTATVKVGLDTKLKARILHVPLLDTSLVERPDTAPRLTEYGSQVIVQIEASQEGVDYQLVTFDGETEQPLSETDVLGNLGNIELSSGQVSEDIDIRVRATKTFEAAEDQETQTDLLDVILPLKVQANPALPVSVRPEPVIDFNQAGNIVLADSQQSASYRLFRRKIPDREIIHREIPAAEVIIVSVPAAPDVQIRKPSRATRWQVPEGYEAIGDFQTGNGGDLQLQFPPLSEDSLFIVQAQKQHQAAADQVIASNLQLEQAAAVLVRPNPEQLLNLKVVIETNQTDGTLEILGGQPGVFYQFLQDEADLGLPAYFHQQDELDETLNKGVGRQIGEDGKIGLKIGIDLAIARTRPPGETPTDPARTPPLPPLVETKPLAVGTTLHIRAMKAQSRVTTMHNQSVTVAALPEIRLQDAVVDYNKATKLLVIASIAGDRYQPFLNDVEFKRALNGNDQDLSFNTDALTQDTGYEMRVTRPGDRGITLERKVWLPLLVRPNPALSVSAQDEVVAPGAETRVQIEAGQQGVLYQLMAAAEPVGAALAGNGQSVFLPTGPLSQATTFAVKATRLDRPDINVMLAQTVTIQLHSDDGGE